MPEFEVSAITRGSPKNTRKMENPPILQNVLNQTGGLISSEDIIVKYVEIMMKDYENMIETEKSWYAVSINLQILDKLIMLNSDVHLIKKFIIVIFKTFLDLKDSIIRDELSLMDILEYNLGVGLGNDMVETYIKMKIHLLRIYSLDADSSKSSFKDITAAYGTNSNFYQLFTNMKSGNVQFAYLLTATMIKLSLSTKTTFKLSFLILANQYSIFTGNIRDEMFTKINKEGIRMISKSPDLVYKFTANHVYALIDECIKRKINCDSLKPLLEKYNQYKKPDESVTLLKPLNKRDSLENIDDMLDAGNFNNLIHSKKDIKQLSTFVKNLDLNSIADKNSLTQLIRLITTENGYFENISGLFDHITMKIKDLKCSFDNIDFIYTSLKMMSASLLQINQHKRLLNCSKLFFYFGNQVINLEPLKSIPYWNSFLDIDSIISITIQEKLITFKRLATISNDQILKNNIKVAFIIQLLFLKTIGVKHKSLFYYESLFQGDLAVSIKLFSKCILTKIESADLLFEYIDNESLIVATTLEIIKCIETTNATDKDSLISQLILKQKIKLKDTGLFFYFLSKVSTIIDFPINFKNGTLNFNIDSAIIDIDKLVISHLYNLQAISNPEDNSTLPKINETLMGWLDTMDENHSTSCINYEFDVISSIYFTFKYNNLHKLCSTILSNYLNKRVHQLSENQNKYFVSYLIDSLLKAEDVSMCSRIISRYSDIICSNEVTGYAGMSLALSMFFHFIKTNSSHAELSLKSIYKAFTSNELFSIEAQKDKYKAVELLMLNARFCKLSGLYLSSNHVSAITNFNRSIGLLQSIFKNFLLSTPNVPLLNVQFKSILKIKFSYEMLECYILLIEKYSTIGFGKEFEYFFKELDMFSKIQPSHNLQYYVNLKLIDFTLFKGSIDSASDYMKLVNSITSKIYVDSTSGNNIMELRRLITFENYARKLGDKELIKSISKDLNNFVFQNLKAPDLNQYILKQWGLVLKRRYENYCEDDTSLITCEEINGLFNSIISGIKILKESSNKEHYISCYPMIENISIEDNDENISKLKKLNRLLVEELKSNFNNSSVEFTKANLDMIVNCFIEMISNSTNSNINKEMYQMVMLNDQYKNYSFNLEKLFALSTQKQKAVLPEITSQPDKLSAGLLKNQNLNLKNVLPTNWQVLTVDYVLPTNSLVIVRYDSRFNAPLFVNISLDGKREQVSYKSILASLQSIIEDSDKTTSIEVTQNINTYEEKSQWWDTRRSLDKKLENLLTDIDVEWLGGFNSLFQFKNVSMADIKLFKGQLIDIVSKYTGFKSLENDKIKQNIQNLHDGIVELFLKIDKISDDKVSHLLNFFLKRVGFKNGEDFDKIEMLEMTTMLKQKIISLSKKRIISDNNDYHIVLVPGSNCIKIPWESIPSLRNKSVTRMPTLSQLESYLVKYKNLLESGVDSNKGYYVLNPGGDLKRTEQNLLPWFKELGGWDGIISKPPTDLDIIRAFDERNLYIYAGHGGGEQYIKSKNIKKRDYIPPSLLLGCSSGALKGSGSIHPYGTVYNYINGGCPMVLVNLWDVTDKDIDLFTVDALKKWGFFVDYDSFDDPFDMTMNNPSLSECIAKSREVCKLKYLNGAAPIIYGLPLSLETT